MASNEDFVNYVVEQMAGADAISSRKMFGEYAVYSGKKVVALICDDKLFIKTTDGGRDFIGEVNEAPPYPGAKMSFLIEDKIDDSEWLSELVRITAEELPEPKPKKKKAKRETK